MCIRRLKLLRGEFIIAVQNYLPRTISMGASEWGY